MTTGTPKLYQFSTDFRPQYPQKGQVLYDPTAYDIERLGRELFADSADAGKTLVVSLETATEFRAILNRLHRQRIVLSVAAALAAGYAAWRLAPMIRLPTWKRR